MAVLCLICGTICFVSVCNYLNDQEEEVLKVKNIEKERATIIKDNKSVDHGFAVNSFDINIDG